LEGGEEQRKEKFKGLYSLSNIIIRLRTRCILHTQYVKYT